MLIKRASDIRSSDITDHKLYLNRREFLGATAATTVAVAAGALGAEALLEAATPAAHGRKLENLKKSALSVDEKPNKWEDITTYNNYYEFGTDKDSPSMLARNYKTEPWSVSIDGECAKKGSMNLEDILKGETLEERVYRHRCVEAWSMVIPWVGFPLANLIKKCEPTSKAKYIEFTTAYDMKQMPGLRSPCACTGPTSRGCAWTKRCTR
jgi:sulfoxide reductase catalytic subunit YedY